MNLSGSITLSGILLLSTGTVRADLRDALATAWSNAEIRSAATVTSLGSTSRWPTIGNGSVWLYSTSTKDWRAGFWPGSLWFISQHNDDPSWVVNAKDWSLPLATSINADHDIGFIVLGSMGKAWLCHDDVNDPGGTYRGVAKTAILRAAELLDNRFNMNGVPTEFTRSWDTIEGLYPVCIDNMMNLEVMLLAHQLDASKSAYYFHALAHARSSIARHLRGDGGTYHVVRHFENGGSAGQIERKNTRQGYGDESTWSRGQAWAIYGFAMTYRYARLGTDSNPGDFLAASESAADYFIDHLPHDFTADTYNHRVGDFVPPSDFDASLGEPTGPWNDADEDGNPGEANGGTRQHGASLVSVQYSQDRLLPRNAFTLRDTSAAAVAASGLLELSALSKDPAKRAKYRLAAENILECLITYDGPDSGTQPDYLSPVNDTQNPGILRLGSEFWGGPNRSLIYGDYYFLEAMVRWETLVTRELLSTSRGVEIAAGDAVFEFERLDPAPSVMFRIQRSESLDAGSWVTIAAKTGAGAWSGLVNVTEEPAVDGKVLVRIHEPATSGRAFYRVLIRSAGGI